MGIGQADRVSDGHKDIVTYRAGQVSNLNLTILVQIMVVKANLTAATAISTPTGPPPKMPRCMITLLITAQVTVYC